MLEQFIFNKISEDETLAELLSAGSDGVHLYPGVIPRDIEFDEAVTFTLITTNDGFPVIHSRNIQFNIFGKSHQAVATIAQALSDLFNDNNNQTSDGVEVVYSIRASESDLGYNFDDGLYQREATYYFKLR